MYVVLADYWPWPELILWPGRANFQQWGMDRILLIHGKTRDLSNFVTVGPYTYRIAYLWRCKEENKWCTEFVPWHLLPAYKYIARIWIYAVLIGYIYQLQRNSDGKSTPYQQLDGLKKTILCVPHRYICILHTVWLLVISLRAILINFSWSFIYCFVNHLKCNPFL